MTTIRPEQVQHGTCVYCLRVKPLHVDGTVITHYLRTRQAERQRKRKCPGSRGMPRPPLDPAQQQLVDATDQAIRQIQRAAKQMQAINQAWNNAFGETP